MKCMTIQQYIIVLVLCLSKTLLFTRIQCASPTQWYMYLLVQTSAQTFTYSSRTLWHAVYVERDRTTNSTCCTSTEPLTKTELQKISPSLIDVKCEIDEICIMTKLKLKLSSVLKSNLHCMITICAYIKKKRFKHDYSPGLADFWNSLTHNLLGSEGSLSPKHGFYWKCSRCRGFSVLVRMSGSLNNYWNTYTQALPNTTLNSWMTLF